MFYSAAAPESPARLFPDSTEAKRHHEVTPCGHTKIGKCSGSFGNSLQVLPESPTHFPGPEEPGVAVSEQEQSPS